MAACRQSKLEIALYWPVGGRQRAVRRFWKGRAVPDRTEWGHPAGSGSATPTMGAVGKSAWHTSKTPVVSEALSNAYRRKLGPEGLSEPYRKLRLA